MSFADEIDKAFKAFARVPGIGATMTFDGTTFAAVVHSPTPTQTKVDMALGRANLVRVVVSKSEVATKCPKVGSSFVDTGRVRYTVADIERADATDPTITFVCKTSGVPSE